MVSVMLLYLMGRKSGWGLRRGLRLLLLLRPFFHETLVAVLLVHAKIPKKLIIFLSLFWGHENLLGSLAFVEFDRLQREVGVAMEC